jgi:hypothetical protein
LLTFSHKNILFSIRIHYFEHTTAAATPITALSTTTLPTATPPTATPPTKATPINNQHDDNDGSTLRLVIGVVAISRGHEEIGDDDGEKKEDKEERRRGLR